MLGGNPKETKKGTPGDEPRKLIGKVIIQSTFEKCKHFIYFFVKSRQNKGKICKFA